MPRAPQRKRPEPPMAKYESQQLFEPEQPGAPAENYEPSEWLQHRTYHSSSAFPMPQQRTSYYSEDAPDPERGDWGFHHGTFKSSQDRGSDRPFVHPLKMVGQVALRSTEVTPGQELSNTSMAKPTHEKYPTVFMDEEANRYTGYGWEGRGHDPLEAMQRGEHIPYVNFTEDTGSISWRSPRENLRTWSEDVLSDPNAAPEHRAMAEQFDLVSTPGADRSRRYQRSNKEYDRNERRLSKGAGTGIEALPGTPRQMRRDAQSDFLPGEREEVRRRQYEFASAYGDKGPNIMLSGMAMEQPSLFEGQADVDPALRESRISGSSTLEQPTGTPRMVPLSPENIGWQSDTTWKRQHPKAAPAPEGIDYHDPAYIQKMEDAKLSKKQKEAKKAKGEPDLSYDWEAAHAMPGKKQSDADLEKLLDEEEAIAKQTHDTGPPQNWKPASWGTYLNKMESLSQPEKAAPKVSGLDQAVDKLVDVLQPQQMGQHVAKKPDLVDEVARDVPLNGWESPTSLHWLASKGHKEATEKYTALLEKYPGAGLPSILPHPKKKRPSKTEPGPEDYDPAYPHGLG